jgi:hypothetical protein
VAGWIFGDRERPPQHQSWWCSSTPGTDLHGTYGSYDFIDCYICRFIANCGRSIICGFIDYTDTADHAGSFITIGVLMSS